ncbi:hypothetical protein Tco_1353376 [Tanacetum coccineum]
MNLNSTINADCIDASTSGHSDTANAFCTNLPFTSSVGIAQSSQHKELCADGPGNFRLTKMTFCFLFTTFRLLLQGQVLHGTSGSISSQIKGRNQQLLGTALTCVPPDMRSTRPEKCHRFTGH